MTITTLVPSVIARARSLGITLKLSSLRDAISYALMDMPYNQAVFSERSGRAIDVVLPPPHFREAAERFSLDPLQLLLAFIEPAKPAQPLRHLEALVDSGREPISYQLDNLLGAYRAPLYPQYQRVQPREAFVKMNDAGVVTAENSSNRNSWDEDVMHEQRTLKFSVPPAVDGHMLAEFLQGDNGHSLLTCIHAGHTVGWDGSKLVSLLTPAAEKAVKQLEEALQNAPILEIADSNERFFSAGKLEDYWTTQPLDEVVAELTRVCNREGLVFPGDSSEWILLTLLQKAWECMGLGLPVTRNVVRELAAHKRIDMKDYGTWLANHVAETIQDPTESALDAAMTTREISFHNGEFKPFELWIETWGELDDYVIERALTDAMYWLKKSGVSFIQAFLANVIAANKATPIEAHLQAWKTAEIEAKRECTSITNNFYDDPDNFFFIIR